MRRVVLASGNRGKVAEINQILTGFDAEVVPQGELGVEDVEETGLSFVENAILKARHASQQTGLPAIADDSGLEVEALKGAPGIYSARYAEGGDDAANWRKLLLELEGEANRRAQFRCLIVYLSHHLDPTPIICQGSWQGEITHGPQGEGGFGYDPVFWVPDHHCTSAELSAADKNRLSHRAQALQQLLGSLTVAWQE